MNRNTLYLTLKTAALAAVFAEYFSADTLRGETVAGALAFCCLFAVDYLFSALLKSKTPPIICAVIGIAACLALGADWYFPLLLMLIFELADLLDSGGYFYGISGASAGLAVLIIRPGEYELIIAFLISSVGIFARIAIERLEYFRELFNEQRKAVSSQTERITKLQAYCATLRESVALEERSRFSTRIHDKLGHGISGSIILLEGVKLNITKNPEQAGKLLETAIENLRGSVDEIRATLREERPNRSSASDAELREMLERFSVDYGLETEFTVEGNTDKISLQIRGCIKENLTEALTNTIKHSNANKFSLKICVYDKIIRVEFSDNGTEASGFSNGMGLDGIDDRVAVCGGKCRIQSGVTGFKIINIFGVDYD